MKAVNRWLFTRIERPIKLTSAAVVHRERRRDSHVSSGEASGDRAILILSAQQRVWDYTIIY